MVSDRDRRELFEALNLGLGEGPATTLMELLPPIGWADVARQSDIAGLRAEMAQLRTELKGEMAELRTELRGEMAQLSTELRGEMAQLGSELRGEMAELRTELKGETAELRAKVDAQLPRFLWANVPIMFGVAGLVLAGAKLA
jgi:hypothetical protein